MEYKITVTEKQARMISSALDVYSRIQGGQFSNVLSIFKWKKLNDRERKKIEYMLTDLKCMLTGVESNGYMGIGEISDDGRIAYDMHQVIRHCIAYNTNPAPTNWAEWTVDYNEPSQYGSEQFCKIQIFKRRLKGKQDDLSLQNH